MSARLLALWRACFCRFDTLGQSMQSGAARLVLGLLVGCALWWGLSPAYGRAAVYFYHPHPMITLSGKTTTQCVGRYLIDVPVELGELTAWSTSFAYGLDANWKKVSVSVELADHTRGQFEAGVQARFLALKTKHNSALKIPLLLASQALQTPHGQAWIFRFLTDDDVSYSEVTSELHILVGHRYAVISGKTYEDSQEFNPDMERVSYKFINPKPMEERLKTIAQHLRGYRDAGQAPEGFCLQGIVMNDKLMGYDIEEASMSINADEKLFPYTELDINMAGQYGQDKESLIERMNRVKPAQRALLGLNEQMLELRKHARVLNGMPGEEYAQALHFSKGVAFKFMAENRMLKEQMSLARPSMSIDFKAGDYGDPSPLDADQAMRIWDGLLNSLRLSPANGGHRIDPLSRTGGFKPTAQVGQPCPRAGLWEAVLPRSHPAAHLLAGYYARWQQVKQGQPMPEILSRELMHDADAYNAQITWRWAQA